MRIGCNAHIGRVSGGSEFGALCMHAMRGRKRENQVLAKSIKFFKEKEAKSMTHPKAAHAVLELGVDFELVLPPHAAPRWLLRQHSAHSTLSIHSAVQHSRARKARASSWSSHRSVAGQARSGSYRLARHCNNCQKSSIQSAPHLLEWPGKSSMQRYRLLAANAPPPHVP